jgi:hypothetical protein
LQRIDDAVNALISPDPAALEFAGRVACIVAIAEAIRTKLNPSPADITEVMGDIAKLLDASITGVDMPAADGEMKLAQDGRFAGGSSSVDFLRAIR